MKVRAIAPGFHGCLRIPDTDTAEFDVPNGSKASWFVPVKKDAQAPKPETSGNTGSGDSGTGGDAPLV